MAFPAYPYPGYQSPYYPQQAPGVGQNQWSLQNPQQPPIMPQAQTVQPAAPANSPQNSGMIWVNSRQEADAYPVLPGTGVALWDANSPMVYLRKADNTGKPSTEAFDLVPHTDAPPNHRQAPQIDLSQYITREQLEEILAERLKKPPRGGQRKEGADNE